MTPEEAQREIDKAHDVVGSARDQVLAALKVEWERWANEIVRRAVVGQPDVSGPMSGADLGLLKANVGMAIASGVSSIESLFSGDLAIDPILSMARGRNGVAEVGQLNKPKEKLAANLYGLLEEAGFRMDELKPRDVRGHSYSWDSFTGDDVQLNVQSELRQYANSISKLASAHFELMKIQTAIASSEVASRRDEI